MANYNDVVLNEYIKKYSVALGLVAVNLAPVFTCQYKGASLYASVAVASGGDMAFKADDTDGITTADANVNTTGAIDLSTPAAGVDTTGEVVDLINASTGGYWLCMLNGGLRADATDNALFTLAAAAGAELAAGVGIMADEGVAPYRCGFSITNRKFTAVGAWSNDIGYLNKLDAFSVKVTSTGGFTVNIYDIYDGATPTTLQNELSKTLLWTENQASNTALTTNFKATYGEPLQAAIGHRLYLEVVGVAAMSIPNSTFGTSYVKILGSTQKVG